MIETKTLFKLDNKPRKRYKVFTYIEVKKLKKVKVYG
jgi:hypothetical protein